LMMGVPIGVEFGLASDIAVVGRPMRSTEAKVFAFGSHGYVLCASALMSIRYFDTHTALHCAIAI